MNKRVFALFVLILCVVMPSCLGSKPISLYERAQRARKLELLITEAVRLMREENQHSLDASQAALELARELAPKDPRVVDGLGCLAWRKKEFVLAEYFFRKALEHDPYYDRAYAHLALLAQQKNKPVSAEKLFKQALSYNPLNYRTRSNYAKTIAVRSREVADLERSYQELLKARESGPQEDPVLQHNIEKIKSLRRSAHHGCATRTGPAKKLRFSTDP